MPSQLALLVQGVCRSASRGPQDTAPCCHMIGVTWMLQTQEMWSLLVPAVWLSMRATESQWRRVAAPGNAIVLIMYAVHYIHRDLIYPFRLHPGEGSGEILLSRRIMVQQRVAQASGGPRSARVGRGSRDCLLCAQANRRR